MEIKVSVIEFKKAISIAKKALPKIILQEERGHILCCAEEDTMVVSATNNDIKAQIKIPLAETIEAAMSFTLDPRIAEKILTKIDIDETTIEYNEEEKTVLVYTTENKQSFTTLQSFPPEKMLTFTIPEVTEYDIRKDLIQAALEFTNNYLAPLKENKKQYDFVILNNGIAYGANGVNKMGFFVSGPLKNFSNFKIRKESVPFMIAALRDLKGEETVKMVEGQKDVGLTTEDGRVFFSCLKSGVESPKINTDLIKGDSAYTLIDKNKLLKTLDRLTASNTSSAGAGIQYELTGVNENASISFHLISNLKAVEQMDCIRVNDEDNQEVSHVLDFKLFKGILSSFGEKGINLYINDASKFFKVTYKGDIEGTKYLAAGIGSYSKVVNNG